MASARRRQSTGMTGCRLLLMKISERIKILFRRQPPTAEELAARAEAEKIRDPREDPVVFEHQIVERLDTTFTPPF